MSTAKFVLFFVIVWSTLIQIPSSASPESVYHDYCVIGAGPAGLQMGFFLERANRDYVIFERANVPGSFYLKYPRHRTLISINKRNTGKTNNEFNLRHDWNSLLSDDDSLLMRHYSRKMFPHADRLVDYLADYQKKLGIKVQFNTTIRGIMQLVESKTNEGMFTMKDQRGQAYLCKTLLVATGADTPVKPKFEGSELAVGYEEIPTDGESFEGQSVMILGRGNAAFETADAIYGNTNFIHIVARSRVRLSWSTHYVGDLRGVNNGLLDTYQLKSLDALAEVDVTGIKMIKDELGKIQVLPGNDGIYSSMQIGDNYPFRAGFDTVIRCLGFRYDNSIFSRAPGPKATAVDPGSLLGKRKKYPNIRADHRAVNVSGLYFIGVISHGLDWRESAGGFIHGYRYTTRAVHRMLEYQNHGIEWPHVTLPITEIISTIVKRINEASGTYQMFYVLGDIYAISPDGSTFSLYEEFPVRMLHDFVNMTGCSFQRLVVNVMEYGEDFSAPGADVFRSGRAVGIPSDAHRSNFLHPAFYYYSSIPKVQMPRNKKGHIPMPEAEMLHFIVEDFNTAFDGDFTHVQPLRRFLENVLDVDLRRWLAEDCFKWILTRRHNASAIPLPCKSYMAQPGAGFHVTSPDVGSVGDMASFVDLGLIF